MEKDHFKYLTLSSEDIAWGIYLNVSGNARINPNSQYPPTEHPSGYYFDWNTGRKLQEYQLIYITEGSGVFENQHGSFPVKPGSMLVVFANEWHRYKPDKTTGWVENYMGFYGELVPPLLKNAVFTSLRPVVDCGIKEEVIDAYLRVNELIMKEQPGYQQIASGIVVKLLGQLVSFEKQKGFSGKGIAGIIEEVRFTMRQNTGQLIDLEQLAQNHNVSYSYLRKMFKKYTGVPLGQYHLQLRIIRAKELLASTDMPIKEISFELGFQTIHYFSLIFKKKVGLNPSEFRKART